MSTQHIGRDGPMAMKNEPNQRWNKGPETPGLFRLESVSGQFLQSEQALPGIFCNKAGSYFEFEGHTFNITVRISNLGDLYYFFVRRHSLLFGLKMA